MMYAGVAILGFGGHARSVADVALSLGVKQLYFADNEARTDEEFAGFPAIRELEVPLLEGWAVFPAAGDNERRRGQVEFALRAGLPLATLVSKSAYIGCESCVGLGGLVGNNVSLGPAVRIGIGSIINTSAVIDHESVIGDFTHVSINSTVAGRCRIGNGVFVGAGAIVIDGVSITDHVIIGAGSVVIRDIDEPGVYVGVPARRLSK